MTPCFSCAWSNHPLISLAVHRISMDFQAWITGWIWIKGSTHSCRWKLMKTLNFLELLVPFGFYFYSWKGGKGFGNHWFTLSFWVLLFSFCLFSVRWCHVTLLESSDTLRIRRTRVDKGNYIWQFHTIYIISSEIPAIPTRWWYLGFARYDGRKHCPTKCWFTTLANWYKWYVPERQTWFDQSQEPVAKMKERHTQISKIFKHLICMMIFLIVLVWSFSFF